MASASTSHDHDVEAQRDVLQPRQPGEDEIHETTIRPSVPAADPAQPVISESQTIGTRGENHETSIHHPEHEDTTRQTPTRPEHGGVQPGADTQVQHEEDHNTGGHVPNDSGQDPHMIGDFHGSTNTLWSLYGTEAKSYDEARIKPLKEDMDGVLIFAGLFATSLTSFVVDSKQSLQVNPTDQVVYYLQQHSTILSQISQQIASIAPEVSIPSTPPPLFPSFKPAASDIRINAFWFMALAFSLSAALLAILVQQWVRSYMHVFQRYSDPQKSARMRQYLYDGSEGWYMPIAAEAVPALHVSLFLFFAGLADTTLNINTTIGLTTIVPIGICGLLYIFITFAPVIYPQSPYQTSFSGVIWYAIQKSRDRRFKDRNGNPKSVNTNMAIGQLQLSMEETKERNERDKRAILWLLDNLTEDTEIESFVTLPPGSLKVWTELSEEKAIPVVDQPSLRLRTIRNVLGLIPRRFRTSFASRLSPSAMVHQPASHSVESVNTHNSILTTPSHEIITIQEFCWRIGHFYDTCKSRAALTGNEDWRMRARVRACVDAMASLIFYADAELGWFGDIRRMLGDVDSFEGVRNLPLAGRDESFIVRWTCLSIMAVRQSLKRPKQITIYYTDYIAQEKEARKNDDILEHSEETERESSLLSNISFAADIVQKYEDGLRGIIEPRTVNLDEAIYKVTRRITHQLPGVNPDLPDSSSNAFLEKSFMLFGDPARLRFIYSRQSLGKYLDHLLRIDNHLAKSHYSEQDRMMLRDVVFNKVLWPKHLLQRSLWSLDDVNEGGLGFAVEVFLLSFKELFSTYASYWQDSHSELFISTFRAITPDRKFYGKSNMVATQAILIDVVASDKGLLRTFYYPDYITDEVWQLLGDILEGETGPHVDSAVQQLTDLQLEVGGHYGTKAGAVISRLRTSHSHRSSPSASLTSSE